MIAAVAAAALAIVPVPAGEAPILLDGKCDAGEYAGAARLAIGEGITMHVRRDAHFLTICLDLPPDSLGTLDVYLRNLDLSITNLHISAQVGERSYRPGEDPPWTFGNQRGWYGPPVAFAGLRQGDGGRMQANFAASSARELQLANTRFGNGPWKVRLAVRALGPDRAGAVEYPKKQGVWLVLTPA